MGRLIAREDRQAPVGGAKEGVVTAEIDLAFADEVKRRYPLMDQRRPEMYGTIGLPKDQVPVYRQG